MIWEAVVVEELPYKALDVNYVDHFVTFSLFNFLCIFHCQSSNFHPNVRIFISYKFLSLYYKKFISKAFSSVLKFL